MPKRPVKRDKKVLDRLFHLPEGVDELDFDAGGVYIDEDSEVNLIDDIEVDVVDTGGSGDGKLATPRIIGIVSQDIKTAPDGKQTVTVVFDVSDVAGAANYEFKVARI